MRHSMFVGDQGGFVYMADDASRGELRGGRIGDPPACYAELSSRDARALVNLSVPIAGLVPAAFRHGGHVAVALVSHRSTEMVWDGEAADVQVLPHDATSAVIVAASAERTIIVRVGRFITATTIAELKFGFYGAQWLDADRTQLVGTRAVDGRPVIARVHLGDGSNGILFAASPQSTNELQAVDDASSAIVARVRVEGRAGYVHISGETGAARVLPWCDPSGRPDLFLWPEARCVVTAEQRGFTSVVNARALPDGRRLAAPTKIVQPTVGPLRVGDAVAVGVRGASLRWRAWSDPQSPVEVKERGPRRAFATMSLAPEDPQLAVISWNEIDAPLATIVALHGGPFAAWGVGGEPALVCFERWARVVRVNYTGSIGYGERYRAAIEGRAGEVDLADVLHVLARASLRWDEPLVLYGESYGAYLALSAALRSSVKVAGVVALAGFASPARLLEGSTPGQEAMLEALFGARLSTVDSLNESRGTLDGAVVLVHGALDSSVPLAEAERIHRRLTRSGIPCQLRILADEGHTLSPAGYEALDRATRAVVSGHRCLALAN